MQKKYLFWVILFLFRKKTDFRPFLLLFTASVRSRPPGPPLVPRVFVLYNFEDDICRTSPSICSTSLMCVHLLSHVKNLTKRIFDFRSRPPRPTLVSGVFNSYPPYLRLAKWKQWVKVRFIQSSKFTCHTLSASLFRTLPWVLPLAPHGWRCRQSRPREGQTSWPEKSIILVWLYVYRKPC